MVTTYLDDLMTEQNIKCSSGDMTESQGPEVKKKMCVSGMAPVLRPLLKIVVSPTKGIPRGQTLTLTNDQVTEPSKSSTEASL